MIAHRSGEVRGHAEVDQRELGIVWQGHVDGCRSGFILRLDQRGRARTHYLPAIINRQFGGSARIVAPRKDDEHVSGMRIGVEVSAVGDLLEVRLRELFRQLAEFVLDPAMGGIESIFTPLMRSVVRTLCVV